MYTHKYYKYKTKYNNLLKLVGGDTNNINFPYIKYFTTPDEIKKIFNNLINYDFVLEHKDYKVYNINFLKYGEFLFKNKPTVLVQKMYQDENYGVITDYFQEECRMRCKRYDQQLSPFDYFMKNKQKVINYSVKTYGDYTNKNLREAIYNLTGECTTFRANILVSIVKLFKSRVILDFSSGWGDRLIGAMACDNIIDYYCGVDPNTCLHPNYQKMIKFFEKNKDKKKYNMIMSPFQTAKIPDKKYDLVMTSPPYFVLEKYTDESTQSISANNNLDNWLHDFLFFSINKCWNLLIHGGYLVININDMRDEPGVETYKFVEDMIKYTNTLKDSKYLGVISYAKKDKNNKIISPQPIWIWQKE